MARRNSIMVSRTLYQIGMVTFVAALMWVAIGIYQTLSKPVNTTIDKSLLEPLTPTLDQEVITALTNRLRVEGEVIILPDTSLEPSSAPLSSPSASASSSASTQEDATIDSNEVR